MCVTERKNHLDWLPFAHHTVGLSPGGDCDAGLAECCFHLTSQELDQGGEPGVLPDIYFW